MNERRKPSESELVVAELQRLMNGLTEAEWKQDQLMNYVNFLTTKCAELKARPGSDTIHPKAWESVGVRLAMLRGQ